MAINRVNPLSSNVPIVDSRGYPTLEFVLKWNAQQAAANAFVVRDVDVLFTDNTGSNASTTKHGYMPKLDNNPLHFFNGQGNQVALPSQSVTPVYTFTFGVPLSLSDSRAYGTRGNIMRASIALHVLAVNALVTFVSGGTYQCGIAPYNTGTNKITSAPTYTTAIIAAASQLDSLIFSFASPLALAANTNYVVFVVRTDVVGTTALDLPFVNNVNPHNPGFIYTPAGKGIILASNGPTTSDTFTTENGACIVAPIYQV